MNRSRREVTPVLFGVCSRGSESGTAVPGIVALARVDLDKFMHDVGALALNGQLTADDSPKRLKMR